MNRPRRPLRRPVLALLVLLGCLACAGCKWLADEFDFLDGAAPHATGSAVGRPDPDAGQR